MARKGRKVPGPPSGEPVAAAWWEMVDDTLDVSLPSTVLRDSVEVLFAARLLEGPTFMNAVLVNSLRPEVRQPVQPAQRVGADALAVYLPGLAASAAIIANVSTGIGVVTPNGDGVNDELALTFDLLKVQAVPEVQVFDLGGRLVRGLAGQHGSRQEVRWDGRDESGAVVAPGLYVCRIRVMTGLGTRTATGIVRVAF